MNPINYRDKKKSNYGVYVAALVIVSWLAFISFAFSYQTYLLNPWNILIVLLLTHLYTGLFITAHDAMHHTVSKNIGLNNFIGILCLILYACFSYKKLKAKHHKHHQYVTTENDPDYLNHNFFVWFFNFMRIYMELKQILIMAIIYNILHLALGIPKLNLVLFWIVPPLLSSLQLFYYGTYLPHRNPKEIENPFKSRSHDISVFWGFVSCYFFGYHYEHHSNPSVPWWQLWKLKISQK
jgi:beta-carotene ketolase (CrtW type)